VQLLQILISRAIGLGCVARGAVTMVPNVGTKTFALDVPYRCATVSAGALVIPVPQLIVIGVTAVPRTRVRRRVDNPGFVPCPAGPSSSRSPDSRC
jgi:hypothetical protein